MSELNIKSWDGFRGQNWLKAESLKEKTEKFVCTSMGISEHDRPLLYLERNKGEEKFQWELNVKNSKFLENSGIKSPEEVVGKTLELTKTKIEVKGEEIDSLRITGVA